MTAIQKAREAQIERVSAILMEHLEIDFDGEDAFIRADSMETAVIAAIAALDAETEGSASINAIAVKPLEWVVPKSGYGQEAYSILGKYWVLHGQFWSPGCTVSKPCRDDAAAKAAAQADFESRIRSALVPPEARS